MKLVIIERNGVINEPRAGGVLSPDDWQPQPGSLEALARLHREGYRVVATTSEPGIAAGALSMETLGRIHARMLELARQKGGEIEAVFICPHAPDDRCRCRAPLPGLFEEIAERLKINLTGVYAVAGSAAGVEAARAASASPVLTGAAASETGTDVRDVAVFSDLAAFTDALLTGQLTAR